MGRGCELGGCVKGANGGFKHLDDISNDPPTDGKQESADM